MRVKKKKAGCCRFSYSIKCLATGQKMNKKESHFSFSFRRKLLLYRKCVQFFGNRINTHLCWPPPELDMGAMSRSDVASLASGQTQLPGKVQEQEYLPRTLWSQQRQRRLSKGFYFKKYKYLNIFLPPQHRFIILSCQSTQVHTCPPTRTHTTVLAFPRSRGYFHLPKPLTVTHWSLNCFFFILKRVPFA